MSLKNKAAFPCDSRESSNFTGINLRQYYAGAVIQGLMASVDINSTNNEDIAKCAIEIADALIVELEKTK